MKHATSYASPSFHLLLRKLFLVVGTPKAMKHATSYASPSFHLLLRKLFLVVCTPEKQRNILLILRLKRVPNLLPGYPTLIT